VINKLHNIEEEDIKTISATDIAIRQIYNNK